MAPEQLLNAIENAPSLRHFVESNLLSRVPWIFGGNSALFGQWREAVATEVNSTAENVYLVGSAATGFSLSPSKAGEGFRRPTVGAPNRPSDLDIAIVDSVFFEQAWNSVIKFDRSGGLGRFLREEYQYRGSETRNDILEMRQNVYWGSISYVHASSGTALARALRSLFAATTRLRVFYGHPPKARIYRRREDLVGYHEQSLQLLKETLRKRGTLR